ncbi:MAG: hypothetical protein AB7K24_00420 [Gemmataceae bacterium]
MSDETRDLNELEQALQGLRPAADLDRDRLMYEAGRSLERSGWFWRASTAAALLIAVGLLSARWFDKPAERVVYVQVKEAPIPKPQPKPFELPDLPEEPRAASASRVAYLALRQRVLKEGVDSLADPEPVPPGRPVRLDDLLKHY